MTRAAKMGMSRTPQSTFRVRVITFNYLILRAMNKRQREGPSMHTRSIGVN